MTAEPAEPVPPGVDATVPSVARIYDYFLGGKDHFPADREAAKRLIDISPDVYTSVRENRAFVRRAVRYAASTGVRQFLDLGSGLPTQGNVHELAGAIEPGSRTVYVDNDPVVAAHGRALLDRLGTTAFVQADLRDPDAILSDPAVCKHLDFDRPVAVLFAAILHFVPDDLDPYGIVAAFREATPPGSLMVLSHGTADPFPERGEPSKQVYQGTTIGLSLRTRTEIERFFEGYDLADPGLVYLPAWRPEPSALSVPSSSSPSPSSSSPKDTRRIRPETSGLLGGVGHKR